jgi:hypothetical protein
MQLPDKNAQFSLGFMPILKKAGCSWLKVLGHLLRQNASENTSINQIEWLK